MSLLKMKWGGNERLAKFSPPNKVVIGGRTYSTVKIGNQIWMAENLEFVPPGMLVKTSFDTTGPALYYFKFDEATAKSRNTGLFYNYYAIEELITNQGTLFPSGWRIPTEIDFDALLSGRTKWDFMAPVSWAGNNWNNSSCTNTTEFSALPVGKQGDWRDSPTWNNEGYETVFVGNYFKYGYRAGVNFNGVGQLRTDNRITIYNSTPIRLVKDA